MALDLIMRGGLNKRMLWLHRLAQSLAPPPSVSSMKMEVCCMAATASSF